MRREINEDLITAESELEAARRRLKIANNELIEAERLYGDRSRRYDALVAAVNPEAK